jgi:molybdate transport system substrate-binding protein
VLARRLAVLLLAVLWSLPAAGAELRVLCPNALRAPMLDAARAFVRGSDHKIEFIFAGVGAIHKRVAGGEVVDIAIGTAQGVDALQRLGRALAGSEAAIARTVLALAARERELRSAPVDADRLAQALRDAASLVYPDAGLGTPGGGQVAELLERLGLTAEVKAKSRLVANASEVAKRVASGAAQLGIAQMNDLVGMPGVVALGPINDPPTGGVVYVAVVPQRSLKADAARAFVVFLTGADAKAAFRNAGYAPAD